MIIGAQMYTLSKQCQTLEGISESFKRVADIGYTAVQLSGLCPYEADWMAEELKKNGLIAPVTHFDAGKIAEDTEETIKFHKTVGAKYIGIGGLRGLWNKDYNDKPKEYWAAFAKDFVPAADKIRDAGLYFMYHNHHYEFMDKDGEILHDFLLKNFSADQMGFICDVYWYYVAGKDPAKLMDSLAGRTPVVHFKDLVTVNGEQRYAPVGSGEIDFDPIIEVCKKNNVEYAMVEQDDCFGEDPFECLKKSFDFLHGKGLC